MCKILQQRRFSLIKNPRRKRRVAEFGSNERNVGICKVVLKFVERTSYALAALNVYNNNNNYYYYYIKNSVIIQMIQTSTNLYYIKIRYL